MRNEFTQILERQRNVIKERPPSFLFYGPTKVGKTRLATTGSKHWNGEAFAPGQELDDMLWIEFDTDGLNTLREDMNVTVPNFISWQHMMAERENNVENALLLVSGLVREILSDCDISYIVIDTLSTLDTEIYSWCMGAEEEKAKTNVNTQRAYGAMMNLHRRFFNSINPHSVGKIWLCHTQVKSIDTMQGAAKKNAQLVKAAQGNELASVLPLITGNKTPEMYKGACSLVAPVLKKTAGDGTEKRIVYTRKRDYDSGSHWESKLDPEEPPDIRRILKKVRGEL